MKNLLLVLLPLSLLFSCSAPPSKEAKFEKSGVSFTCPAGWKITEEDSLDGDGYYLACEKDGLVSSGLFTLTWVNDTVELEEMMKIYQDELKNNVIFKNTNISFSASTDGKYNNYEAIRSTYNLTLLGDKTEGIMYCFYGNGKTIGLVKQQSLEDDSKNKEGFETIETTFTSK